MKILSIASTVILLLLAAALYFLTLTQGGLQLIGRTLESELNGTLQLGELQGSLFTTIHVDDLRLQVANDIYQAANIQLNWSPLALLSGELRVNQLVISSVDVTVGKSSDSDHSDFSIDVDLPLAITVSSASLNSLKLTGLSDETVEIDSIYLSASAVDDQLNIASLLLETKQVSAELEGIVGLLPQKHSELDLGWSINTADVTTTGQAAIAGLLNAYHLDGTFSLAAEQIPPGQWTVSGDGDLSALSVTKLSGEILHGAVSGQATLDWSRGIDWQATVSMQSLDPSVNWPDWPGELSSALTTSGHVSEDSRQYHFSLVELQGQLRGYPLAGNADIEFDNALTTINALDLSSGENRLTASGSVEQQWDASVHMSVTDVAAVLPGWEGRFELDAAFTGARIEPVINVTFDSKQLTGPELEVDAVTALARLHWSESAQQSIEIKAENLLVAVQSYDQLNLQLNGALHNHVFSMTATGEQSAVNLHVSGDWTDQHWRGELSKADWQYPGAGAWTLQQTALLELGTTQVTVPELCWVQQQAFLCVQASGDPAGTVSSRVQLKAFPLVALGIFERLPFKLTNRVDADLQVTMTDGHPVDASILVNLGAGSVNYQDSTLAEDSYIRSGLLRAAFNVEGVSAAAELQLSGNDYLRANLALTGYQPAVTPWEKQPLDLDVQGELHDMLFIKYLLDEVGRYEGTMIVDLQGGGTLSEPRLSGGASISDSSLEIDSLGIILSDLDIQLRSKDDGLIVMGQCDSGDGSIELSGDITFNNIASWQADVHLKGRDFEAMHLPEGIIVVSPDIRAEMQLPELRLTGELHVPYARLRPKDLTGRTGLSSDVIIIDDNQQAVDADERWQVTSRIRLSLGDDVTIDGYGLKGDILGGITLQDQPGKATTARGQLSIERGSYEIYGRKLDIHNGQLLFSGGAVDNPGLDFRASRKVDNVTAGIRASGTLRKPELSLYSDPTMSDSDIISYIAFGHAQSEVGQGGGSVTDSGLVAGGNMLAGALGSKVGLDELGIESGETLEEAAMVLGTYLSPQLYVRYRTGLYDAISEFEVRYEFSRRWSVRSITSVEASSAEVQFSFER